MHQRRVISSLTAFALVATMAVITALVVLGGLRRLGRFSAALVPLMTVAYILGALVVIHRSDPDLHQTLDVAQFHDPSERAGV